MVGSLERWCGRVCITLVVLCAVAGVAQAGQAAPPPVPAAGAPIAGVEQTLYPDADAWIEDDSFDNKGTDNEFRSGCEGKVNYRALLHFDLSTLQKQPVRSAILRIGSFNGGQGTNYKFMRIQALYRAWDEKSVTWGQAEKDNGWIAKGGDILPEGYGGADMAPDAGGGKERLYSFDITTLVQGWQNKSIKNHGLMIMNEPGSDIMLRIHSREATANRPHLLIGYTAAIVPPDPGVRAMASIQPLPGIVPVYSPKIATTTLNAGNAGQVYKVQLKASGGERPYKWEAVGKLPDGFTLSDSGELAGTSEKAMTATLRVKCTGADKRGSDTVSLKLVLQANVINPENPAGPVKPVKPVDPKPVDPTRPNDDG
ncbi:MAG TPA: DNRLRE domain-containing protein [Planctomycetota bacterium]|nr:DNRLRE domain-containing protein [Planctomycetota bacterium]